MMTKIKCTLAVTYTNPSDPEGVIEVFDVIIRDDDVSGDGYEATDVRIAEWEVDES